MVDFVATPYAGTSCANQYTEFKIPISYGGPITVTGIYSGSLPPGMYIDYGSSPSKFWVVGTCSFPGTYTAVIWHRTTGLYSDYYEVTLTINACQPIDTSSIPPIKQNHPYYHILRVQSEKNQSAFSVTQAGTLPSGITFDPIPGSPTLIGETAESGVFPVVFTVTDNDTGCTVDQDYAFDVSSLYLNTVLPCTKPGLPYKISLVAEGGVYPYRYHVRTNYSLPSDLMLDTYTGLLHGSVYKEGLYVIGVRVFDGRNDYIDHDLTLICSKECLPTTFDWLPSMQSTPVVVGESFMEHNLQRLLPSLFEV